MPDLSSFSPWGLAGIALWIFGCGVWIIWFTIRMLATQQKSLTLHREALDKRDQALDKIIVALSTSFEQLSTSIDRSAKLSAEQLDTFKLLADSQLVIQGSTAKIETILKGQGGFSEKMDAIQQGIEALTRIATTVKDEQIMQGLRLEGVLQISKSQ